MLRVRPYRKEDAKAIVNWCICIVTILMLTGCGKLKEKDVDIDELKTHDETMFCAIHSNWGEVSKLEDYWVSTTYIVHYDGTLEVTEEYNLSGETTKKTQLADEDLMSIYLFAYNAANNHTFSKAHVDASDGSNWSFTFYDLDGNASDIYNGYTYGIKKLEAVQELLEEYEKVRAEGNSD
ncbi:MAG: hypothetical protein PUB28_06375 [Roseburia sp.]|nr:hypothetical protein [Roseburia sp.]